MTMESIMDSLTRTFERSQSASDTAPRPASDPSVRVLANIPSRPLTWLWPGYIPFGHITLLDAAPGCDPSLFALTIAACVSSGSPFPGGTAVEKDFVTLLVPYDSPSSTIKPRLEAAGGDPIRVILINSFVEHPSSNKAIRTRSFEFSRDLDYLAATIRKLNLRVIIFDPASAFPGLSRCLPILIEIANQANCAILLTRSLRQPPADPFSPAPPSPLLEAARTRLLITPDPADERQCLLLATRHLHSSQPPVLAYQTLVSEAGVPTIHWLGGRDSSNLVRLSTGPLRSPQRQAILRYLQNSPTPRSHKEILEAACYDDRAGRKMIWRMKLAGELVRTERGLYTTPNHPCLAQSTGGENPPVTNVTNVPTASAGSTGSSKDTTQNDWPVTNVPNSAGKE